MARKLALRPAEIVEFLAANQINIEEGSNTRLDNDHVRLIMQKFAPGELAEIAEEFSDERDIDAVGDPAPAPAPVFENNSNEEGIDPSVSAPNENAEIEIIKAPKIALSGLKVLGKIDLPETKKKEPEHESPVDPAEAQIEKTASPEMAKTYLPRKQRMEQRPVKNPIALQRDRETKEAQKKRQEQLERDKERKTQNYLKRVKVSAPTKSVKLVEEPLMEMTAAELAEPPKTVWGKFIKWLRT